MKKLSLKKLFGDLKMTWLTVLTMAVALGVWTALMALLVPETSSFHDIAVTMEWWVLPAILIIVNSKKPLDAALKTFVFFLISQPLVYLIQVPFNSMGWKLFDYYPYWFKITLLTLPGAYLGWFIKKDQWYSGIILAVITVLLAVTGISMFTDLIAHFPNHLLTTIYCFGIIPIFIFSIFKNKVPRIITAALTIASVIICLILNPSAKPLFETYNNTFLKENQITLVGKPTIVSISQTTDCGGLDSCVEIVNAETGSFKLRGREGGEYTFIIEDESGATYKFKYYFDPELKTVIIQYQFS